MLLHLEELYRFKCHSLSPPSRPFSCQLPFSKTPCTPFHFGPQQQWMSVQENLCTIWKWDNPSRAQGVLLLLTCPPPIPSMLIIEAQWLLGLVISHHCISISYFVIRSFFFFPHTASNLAEECIDATTEHSLHLIILFKINFKIPACKSGRRESAYIWYKDCAWPAKKSNEQN